MDSFEKDLAYYGVTNKRVGERAQELVSDVTLIFGRELSEAVTGWRILIFGLCIITFLATTALDQLSDRQIEGDVEELQTAQGKFEGALEVIEQVRGVVLTKHERIEEALKGRAGPPDYPECKECAAVLGPAKQIATIMDAAHRWFKSMGNRSAAVRVAVFAELEQGFLSVVASTNGSQTQVVTTPNSREYKEKYRIGLPSEREAEALVAKAFEDDDIIIIPDTSDHPAFNFFTKAQRKYLKSIVACPLHLQREGRPMAVLCADANVSGYFQDSDAEAWRILLLADEIALRLSFELNMLNYIRKDGENTRQEEADRGA